MLRLKTLRKGRGLSLKDLGGILGVSESTVSLYENSKREAPYWVLQKLSEIFSVSIDYLLNNSDSESSNSLNIPILDSVTIDKEGVEFIYNGESEPFVLGNLDEYFFYKVADFSMAPQISKGDTALIKKQSEIESGDIAAIIFKDSGIILRKVVIQDSVIVLQAFEPALPPEFVGNINDLTILGKVIQSFKKW